MRHVVSALTLAAFVGSLLSAGPAGAQTAVSTDLADRLRAAVADRQSALSGTEAEELAARLAEANRLDEVALDDLVAPVALYPDALLAQVLVAATYPDQIARAGELIAAGGQMTDAELSDALAAQEWDPSVLVLLSDFPTVIARMAEDLDWTARLGGAMLHQDPDVLAAVQRMRVRAEEAGNLQSNAAQVVDRTPESIAIRPADPQRIYVPEYDPELAYVSNRNPAPYLAEPAPYPYLAAPAPYIAPPPRPAPGVDMTTALVGGAVAFGAGYLVNQMLDDDNDRDKDKNDRWKNYWRGDRTIDWREQRFYPRPYSDTPYAWQEERDRYWDRSSGRWRLDEAARRRDAQERRDLLRWAAADDQPGLSDREERRLQAWRAQAREDARREAERRAARQEREAREQRRLEQAREERRAEQARADRQAERVRQERLMERRREQQQLDQAQQRRQAEQAQERRAQQQQQQQRQAQERRVQQGQAQERQAEERRAPQAQQRQGEERRAQQAQQRQAEERRAQQAQQRQAQERQAQQAQQRQAQQRQAQQAQQRQAQERRAQQAQQRQAQQAQERRAQQRAAQRDDCRPNDDRRACRQN